MPDSWTHKKRILIEILVSLMCAGQAMVALSLSMAYARRFLSGSQINLGFYCAGAVILLLFELMIVFLTAKPLAVSCVFLTVINAIALINYYELLFHGTVFTHQDIKNFGTAFRQVGNYTFRITRPVICILVSYFAVMIVLAVLRLKKVRFKACRLASVVSAGVLCVLSYCLVFAPFALVPAGGWSWEIKYFQNGYVLGTMENIRKAFTPMRKPDGYDASQIKAGAGLPAEHEVFPDIIMILNESYYNMDWLADFEPDAPCMANYNRLDAYKGYAAVPYIGGGTNASEYELLTSNSMSLLSTSTPFNDLSFSHARSLVEYLEKLGYATMAAHPEPSRNYHRDKVWRELGFDEVFFDREFKNMGRNGKRRYCTDSTAFQNLQQFYEAMPESQPRFVYLLTMQNHGDWNKNNADLDTVHIRNAHGLSEYDQERMNEYLSCLCLTDALIEEMVEYYSGIDRNVVLYMVGDHCPSLVKESGLMPADGYSLRKRQTPYFIWSNYPANFAALPDNHNLDLCALTPCALLAAGLPVSPYYAQVLQLSQEVSCFTAIDVEDQGNDLGIGFVLNDGTTETLSAGTAVADAVQNYFYMEYNGLLTKGRIDRIFDPR